MTSWFVWIIATLAMRPASRSAENMDKAYFGRQCVEAPTGIEVCKAVSVVHWGVGATTRRPASRSAQIVE